MGKKDRKPPVVNNIQELNLEIDYDKLAEAIIKAKKIQPSPAAKKKNFREKAMSLMNGILYAFIYVIALLCIVEVWRGFSQNPEHLVVNIFCTAVFGIFGVYAFLCQQEALKDNGQEAQTHFNSNIALIALILAILTFFREM